ncbi:hypothetical protein QMA0440_01473 [Yersinia ruckeri]|nr:hypothetical protein QMA0440_01473 [Yersinia ruckeri]KFE37236.1 hypothetical protein nADLYRO1b_3404 [Yersinia ruckeri]
MKMVRLWFVLASLISLTACMSVGQTPPPDFNFNGVWQCRATV